MTKPLVFEAWPLCIADRLTRIAERSTPLRILPVPRNSWHHRRYSELIAKGATPQLTVDNSKTQGDALRAAIRADNAVLENLKVQLSFCFIRAPITGRISQAAVRSAISPVRATLFPSPPSTRSRPCTSRCRSRSAACPT